MQEFFDKATTRGDIAVLLIFGTLGYTIDAGLNLVGFLEPGIVGSASAAGALGVKKAIEAQWAARTRRKELARAADQVELLIKFFRDENRADLATPLESALRLHERGILDKAALDDLGNDALQAYLVEIGLGRSDP